MTGKRPSRGWLHQTPFTICLLILLVIAAYFLLSEHRAHLLGALPLMALLLLCPLMHILMHRGHHHRQGRPKGEEQSDRDEENQ